MSSESGESDHLLSCSSELLRAARVKSVPGMFVLEGQPLGWRAARRARAVYTHTPGARPLMGITLNTRLLFEKKENRKVNFTLLMYGVNTNGYRLVYDKPKEKAITESR